MRLDPVRVVGGGEMGKGVVATRRIEPGEVVLEFRGDLVANRGSHTLQIARDQHLEVEPPGRFVNHSCDPNCGIRGTRLLVARHPIDRGDEITFDYAMTEVEMAPLECGCGTPACRGTITGYAGLPEKRRREYEGYISEYLRR
ncbi:MAG: SET domain-containing protein [Alkalispirochaetaceae bacterium]